jgi:hypothetical protein
MANHQKVEIVEHMGAEHIVEAMGAEHIVETMGAKTGHMDAEVFQRGERFYQIDQTVDESREQYLERVQYIIDRLDSIPGHIDIVMLSYVWRNIRFHGAVYPEFITMHL